MVTITVTRVQYFASIQIFSTRIKKISLQNWCQQNRTECWWWVKLFIASTNKCINSPCWNIFQCESWVSGLTTCCGRSQRFKQIYDIDVISRYHIYRTLQQWLNCWPWRYYQTISWRLRVSVCVPVSSCTRLQCNNYVK